VIAELAERRALTRAQWGRWKPTTLSDHFDACAGKWPDSPFMITDETLTTYQQLVDRSWRIAGAAARAGIKPDDRLAIIMGNSADFVAAKVAASRLGAIAVPVNYLLSPPELGVVLASAKPRLVMAYGQVGPADVVSLLEKVGLPDADNPDKPTLVLGKSAEIPPGALALEGWLNAGGGVDRAPLSGSDAPEEPIAEILYTSGSTGVAKGVALKHHALLREGYTSALARALAPGWRTLTSLPTFHLFGWVQAVLPTTFVGGAVIVREQFDPAEELALVSKLGVQDIVCVPAMLHRLVDLAEASHPALDSLQAIFAAGDPVPAELWQRSRKALGVQEITNGYGMTEVSGAPFILPIDATDEQLAVSVGRFKRPGDRGIPDEDVTQREFRIVDPATMRPVEVGEVGEIQYRGSSMFAGYWENEAETQRVYTDDGWFRSGDMGKLRPDDMLVLTGRIKELYRTGGELVSPSEVESVIAGLEGVSAVYVVGVPDPRWGEIGWAFVVPTPGSPLTPEDVVEFCRERLAKYKVPRRVRLLDIDAVPKNASGKVQKASLVTLAQHLEEKGEAQ
jgi:fatty-acyl-CoA synthase